MNKEELIKELTAASIAKTTFITKIKRAMTWFSYSIKRLNASRQNSIAQRFSPGTIIMFYYDPIHKKTLPYYDEFPLVIILQKTKNGFLGLNLHYIPPQIRSKILLHLLIELDSIGGIVENAQQNEVVRLKLTHKILQNLTSSWYFYPCIREYNFDKVRSKMLNISSSDWVNVVNLPFENFVKESKTNIWKDYIKQIG